MATLAWELDLSALKQLAVNSLRYSAMTEGEKRAAFGDWQQQWAAWLTQRDQMRFDAEGVQQ